MSAANDFKSRFDESGRFRNGSGEVSVVFATQGTRLPGKLYFRDGLCVRASLERGGDWRHPDDSPLDGIRFLLDFDGTRLTAAITEGQLGFGYETRSQAGKQDFLANLKVARNLFVHPQVFVDRDGVDPQMVARRMARAAIWLTPKSVAGFNAADFPELGNARQAELLSAIQAFLVIAKDVPPDQPATNEQVEKGSFAFEKILHILEPYLAVGDETQKVEAALQAVKFPSWVVNWDYELGSNHDGEAAVWVLLFAEDGSLNRETPRVISRLFPEIRESFKHSGIDRWPYIRVKTAAEHKAR